MASNNTPIRPRMLINGEVITCWTRLELSGFKF